MDATTLERVKDLLDLDVTDVTQDTVLSRWITGASRRIEVFLRRPLESTTRTEYYDVTARMHTLWLYAYPASAITSVKYAPAWDFSTTTALDSTTYRLTGATGELFLGRVLNQFTPTSPSVIDREPQALEISYTGGIAADTDELIQNYPDIAEACELQVIAMHNRGGRPEASAQRINDSTVTYTGDFTLIKSARDLLSPYTSKRVA